ncbi:MAG: hypothetical protein L0K82_06385 [Pisciglobus halotolerans]|nr:hypothetical protein [Pisciglobus halotolerans]
MTKILNELVEKFPVALTVTGLSIISFPFFFRFMANSIAGLVIFIIWCAATSFLVESFINKGLLGEKNYNKAKRKFAVIQLIVDAVVLLLLLYFF